LIEANALPLSHTANMMTLVCIFLVDAVLKN